MISDELCEKIIEVDGEAAAITLLDTWDAEVRWETDLCESDTHRAVNLLSNCVCVFLVTDWQRMDSGALHADRWRLPVAVLCNWPGLVPASLWAPDNPAPLPSRPAHADHPGGEQMWPGATQRGVSQWWGHTIPACLCVCVCVMMSTIHFFCMLIFDFLFQRVAPVLLCLTASSSKPQPPCSTTSGRLFAA